MRKGYIVFDIGTGNTRAGLWTSDGELLAVERSDTTYHTDPYDDKSTYFVPAEWEAICYGIVERLMAQKPDDLEIAALSASSIRQSMVCIAEDGEGLIGIPNSVSYTLPYVQEMDWSKIIPKTYLFPHGIYIGAKWYSLKRVHPEITDRTKYVCSISDWIGFLFTGNAGYSVSNCSQTAMYDAEKKEWSDEMCAVFEMPKEKLAPIIDDGDIVGPVKPEMIERFGFAKDCVYVMGIADTQSGMYGANTKMGEICVVAGTTTPNTIEVPEFKSDGRMWISTYTSRDTFMLENNAGSTGVNLMRMRNMFFPDKSFDELNETCLNMGHMPRVLACYAAGMHIDGNPIFHGAFLSEWQFRHDMVPEEWYYALSIDNGCSTSFSVNRLAEYTEYKHDYILGCGGGVKSPIVSQTIANLTGKELILYNNFDQATMYGCVRMCNKAVGLAEKERYEVARYTPKKDEALEQWYEDWKTFRECLRGMNGKWL